MASNFYFVTSNPTSSFPTALWASDGTAAGTSEIASVGNSGQIQALGNFLGGFAFAVTSNNDTVIYYTLGTADSTRFFYDIGAPVTFSLPPTPLNNTVINPGTTATTSPNGNANVVSAFSSLTDSERQFFIAYLPETLYGLGVGESGSIALKNGNVLLPPPIIRSNQLLTTAAAPTSQAAPPTQTIYDLTNFGTLVFFGAGDPQGVANLWSTDGTSINTTLVLTGSVINNLVVETNGTTGQRLFFSEQTSAGDGALAVVNANRVGATILKDFGAGTVVTSITVAGSALFIAVQTGTGGALFYSDGTNAAAAQIGTFSGPISQATAYGNGSAGLYFTVGGQLYAASSTAVTSLGTFGAISNLAGIGGTLYFSGDTGTGAQPWTSTGTPATTARLKAINASGGSSPADFVGVGGSVVFVANDGVHGNELWRTDGTAAGTSLAVDLDPGAAGSNPGSITPTQPGALTAGTAPQLVVTASGVVTDGTEADTYVGGLGRFQNSGQSFLSYSLALNLRSNQSGVALTIAHGPANASSANAVTVDLVVPNGTQTASGGNLFRAGTGEFFTTTLTDLVGGYASTSRDALWHVTDGSLQPVDVADFPTLTNNQPEQFTDQVAVGNSLFFLRDLQDGNFNPTDTQLWVSDGTRAGTSLVKDFGTLFEPAIGNAYNKFSNAIAGGSGYAVLLEDQAVTFHLETSDGTAAGTKEITTAAIGITGTINNGGTGSLGALGNKLAFSVANGGTIRAVVSNGTAAGTTVVASEASTTKSFGDFVSAGTLIYFDDGVGGALWASDGTAAGTTELLTSGAYIAPYTNKTYLSRQASAPVASTASIVANGTSYFYFTTTLGGQTGLYRSDGRGVQVVQANSLATQGYIVAADGQIFFNTLKGLAVADPVSNTTRLIIDPAQFPAGSVLAQAYGTIDGQNLTVTPTIASPNAFYLTPGNDTVATTTGDAQIYTGSDSLNPGDVIVPNANGINNLFLVGAGTFNLGLPGTFQNVQDVISNDPSQTVLLRAGTSLSLNISTGVFADTVIGAANSDVISGAKSVIAGGNSESVVNSQQATLTAATAGALLNNVGTAVISGGGVVNLNPADIVQVYSLTAPTTVTLRGNGLVFGSGGSDTITLGGQLLGGYPFPGAFTVTGGGGGDTFNLQTMTSAAFVDTGTNLSGSTITGFNFGTAYVATDPIDITDFAFSSSETVNFSAGTLRVDQNGAGTRTLRITLPGTPKAGGGFVLAGDGASGSLLTYTPQLVQLTTNPDNVVLNGPAIVQTRDGGLSPGDVIIANPTLFGAGGIDSDATLQLIGPGAFNLGVVATISGLGAIAGDSTGGTAAIGQFINLRNGLDTNVILGPGADTVFGADNAAVVTNLPEANNNGNGYSILVRGPRETFQLTGQPADRFYINAATAEASLSDVIGSFYQIPVGTAVLGGGGVVGLGPDSVRVLQIGSPTLLDLLDYTVPFILGSGNDTINAAYVGGEVIQPNGGAGRIIGNVNLSDTAADLRGLTWDGFNFLPGSTAFLYPGATSPIDTIDITDLPFSSSVSIGFTNGLLTVGNGNVSTFLTLTNAPVGGTFTASIETGGTGTVLGFVPANPSLQPVAAMFTPGQTAFAGTPGDDILTITQGALAAGQTIDGQGGINQITLSGTGTFDLSAPSLLKNFQLLTVGGYSNGIALPGATVNLRAGLPLIIQGQSATIQGAASADPIALNDFSSGNNVIVGSAQASVLDGGQNDTVTVSALTIGATIEGGHRGTTLNVVGGGTAAMGANISGITLVSLTQTGLDFKANDLPGLAIAITDTTAGLRDIVRGGAGSDLFQDFSTGGNTLVAGSGFDSFQIGGNIANQTLNTPVTDTIVGFGNGGFGTINLGGLFFGTASFTPGTLTIRQFGTGTAETIFLPGITVGTFTTRFLGNSSTGVDYLACFVAGTRILAQDGEIPVEDLRIGDRIVTRGQRHGLSRIVWIGRRAINPATQPDPERVLPIRVQAHTFGPGAPHSDLFVSPDHALAVDGVLIPARCLVNGHSIAPVTGRSPVVYYHLEIDRHEVLVANGMAAESWLDTGNRSSFENAPVVDAFADFECGSAPAALCADLVTTGPSLVAVRQRLEDAARVAPGTRRRLREG